MVALLVGMAITAVWMTALLPSWKQQATRQKEDDLVYRGEQYARALPRSRLAVVEGAGHLVDMEQPEALAKLIVQFVVES